MGLDRPETGTNFVVGRRPAAGGANSRSAAAALACIGLLYLGFAIACIIGRAGVPVHPGWTANAIGGVYTVDSVEETSNDAALRPGDRLLSVAGDAEAGFYGPALALSRVPYGAAYPVQGLRGRTNFTVFLSINSSRKSKWRETIPNLLLAFVLCTAAVFIAALRWSNISAKIAAACFMTNGLAIASVVLIDYPGWGRLTSALAIGLTSLHRPWELALTYDFCSRFPFSVEETGVVRWSRRILYGCAALLWIPFNAPVLPHIFGAMPWSALVALVPFRPDGQYGGTIIAGFESVTAVLCCLVLGRNYLHIRTPGLRRRMRWAVLAVASSVSTFLLFAFLKLIYRLTGSVAVREWALFVDNAAAIVVGLSFIAITYAVTQHRIFGIRLAIRQGFRYLLAKNVLRSMMFLPFLILVGKAIGSPDKSLRDVLLQSSWPSYSALAAAGLFGLRYQVQIRPWLDRRFFRMALGQEQMLLTLVDRIRQVESVEELCLIAGRVLDEALHVDGCHIFLREPDGRLRVAYSQCPGRATGLREWLNRDGVDFLRANSSFMLYEIQDRNEEEDAYASEPAEYLMIPVSGPELNSELTLALGPKRSEEPYTRRDHDLLKGIAVQMAIVREMLELKKSVEQERRTRVQVLGHLDSQRVQLLTECPDCGRCYTTAESKCAYDGVTLSLTLPVERMIDGKYLLERRMGRGGMGVVYAARDLRLHRPVAIKMMMGDLFGNSAALSRFEREARTVAALNHFNIVAVYDFGRLPAGGAYLVMELINGESWRSHLALDRGMELQRAYSAIRQLCIAVEAAHARGVIHRDLKPENIVIADDVDQWRVVVLDFGLAKFRSDLLTGEQNPTISGTVIGTLGYMSPEQRSGRNVGPSTDVYSVAVICAETLTGVRPPRYGISPTWLKSAFRCELGVHEQLYRVVERALARNPRQRPSVLEFVECIPDPQSVDCLTRSSPSVPKKTENTTDLRGTGTTERLTSESDTANAETLISRTESGNVQT